MTRPVVKVDELDFEILREMFLGSALFYRSDRVSVDAVARKLGVHRKTVAARVKRISAAGLGLPLTIAIEPWSIGIVRAKVFLPGAKLRDDDMIETLRHIEGLQLIIASTEGIDVIIWAEDDHALATRVELARRLTGARGAEWDIHSTRDFPGRPPYRITSLDAKILAVLVTNARVPFPKVAAELGVTTRTVERRFERLARDGVVTMLPGGDGHSRFAGATITSVMFELAGDDKARRTTVGEIMRLFPNHFVRNLIPSGRAHLLVYAVSAAALDDQLVAASELSGVSSITTRSVTWIGANPRYSEWLQSVLERRVRSEPSPAMR